jgi:hypothetical protein
MRIVIAGGGWSGCAAALQVAKMGAEAVLLERTDMLLGTGLVGGIMRNNGRYTATEELIALGGGEIFQAIDANYLHSEIHFPGHDHAFLYNVATMEPIIYKLLEKRGITLKLTSRLTDVKMKGTRIESIVFKEKGNEEPQPLPADVFVDTTGTAGPAANCNKYGNGCAMCVLRCHSFGGRISLAAKAGVKERVAKKNDQTGAFSGSCKLFKESLDPDLVKTLDEKGVAVVPIPKTHQLSGKLAIKACQQYALPAFENNLVLLDTGHAKLMTPYFPLAVLRLIPGFENARFEDPYAGGMGNSIRYMGMPPREDTLKVEGVDNLFCAGEKAGLLVGHTEAICTGTLAAYNAVKLAMGDTLLVLPKELVIGDAIRHVRRQMQTPQGLGLKYTFSGSVLFDRMKEKQLYTTDKNKVCDRVFKTGLNEIFS